VAGIRNADLVALDPRKGLLMKSDLIASLESLEPRGNRNVHRIVVLFGDQPEVLDAIRQARARKCSFGQIAKALSTPSTIVSAHAVQNWLAAQGID